MSSARNRFGVSILVGLAITVFLSGRADGAGWFTREAASAPIAAASVTGDASFGVVGSLDSVVSSRTQLAVGLGAAVPLLLFAIMVKRRVHADL